MKILDSAVHIVQIGSDLSLLHREGKASDTYLRQKVYTEKLSTYHSGSRMSFLLLNKEHHKELPADEGLYIIPVYFRGRRDLWNIFRALVKLHQKNSISVITTQNVGEIAWVSLFFGKLYNVPIVGQIHYDFFSQEAIKEQFGSSGFSKLRYFMSLNLLSRYQRLRVVGSSVKKALEQRNVFTSHLSPVICSMLSEDPPVRRKSDPEKPVVLFVGRLVNAKNLFDWLKVASLVSAKVPACQFQIVGGGELSEALKEEIDLMGLSQKIELVGKVPYTELHKYYESASVFLLTSYYEGFGRVLVESYYYGVPVVSTWTSGTSDIVEDGKIGFLHPVGDLESLAKSAVRLLKDTDLNQSMGQSGRESVYQRYAPERLSAEWVDMLVNASLV